MYQGDGLNLYAYCHNNPVKYYDPSGYAQEMAPCGGNGNIGEGQETRAQNGEIATYLEENGYYL